LFADKSFGLIDDCREYVAMSAGQTFTMLSADQ